MGCWWHSGNQHRGKAYYLNLWVLQSPRRYLKQHEFIHIVSRNKTIRRKTLNPMLMSRKRRGTEVHPLTRRKRNGSWGLGFSITLHQCPATCLPRTLLQEPASAHPSTYMHRFALHLPIMPDRLLGDGFIPPTLIFIINASVIRFFHVMSSFGSFPDQRGSASGWCNRLATSLHRDRSAYTHTRERGAIDE